MLDGSAGRAYRAGGSLLSIVQNDATVRLARGLEDRRANLHSPDGDELRPNKLVGTGEDKRDQTRDGAL
jgi:hypothetical protein